jgi:hypothetical protein
VKITVIKSLCNWLVYATQGLKYLKNDEIKARHDAKKLGKENK